MDGSYWQAAAGPGGGRAGVPRRRYDDESHDKAAADSAAAAEGVAKRRAAKRARDDAAAEAADAAVVAEAAAAAAAADAAAAAVAENAAVHAAEVAVEGVPGIGADLLGSIVADIDAALTNLESGDAPVPVSDAFLHFTSTGALSGKKGAVQLIMIRDKTVPVTHGAQAMNRACA